MNEQQLRVILDPANKNLPDIVSGLTPRSVSRSTHSGLGASGGKPVAPASVYYISGIFQCLTAVVGLLGAVVTIYQFAGGKSGEIPDTSPRFSLWLRADRDEHGMVTWTNAKIVRAVSDLCTVVFGVVLFITSLVLSSKKGTIWYIMFAIWSVIGSTYFAIGDVYTIFRNTCPALHRLDGIYDGESKSDFIQGAMGWLGLLLSIPATVMMALEPTVPVEFRNGLWQIDTLLTSSISVGVGLVLIASTYAAEKTPAGTKARRFVGASLVSIYTALFAKGLLEFFMANTVAYADVSVRTHYRSDVSEEIFGYLNSYPADGSGSLDSDYNVISFATDLPPSALNGLVYVWAQSWNYTASGYAGFQAVVAALPGALQGFVQSGAIGEYLRLTSDISTVDPGRAAVGPRGLYLVDVAEGKVEVFPLPLRFDGFASIAQTVVSGLDRPSGICVGIMGDGFETAERIFVAEGATVRLFDASGKAVGSLAGAKTQLSQPFSLAVDASNTWLIVADRNAGLLKFKLSDSGDVEPAAQWTFAPNQLTDVGTDKMGNIVYTVPDAINFMSLQTSAAANPVPDRSIRPQNRDTNIIGLALST